MVCARLLRLRSSSTGLTMRVITTGLILLQVLGLSLCDLSEWRSKSVDLCADPLYLVCGPSTELVVGRAAYRAEGCTCPSCQGISVHERTSALREVHRACTGRRYCHVINLLPWDHIRCNCHRKVLEVEYACVRRYKTQAACGEEEFKFENRGIVANARYPESNELRRCSVIFGVEKKRKVIIRPMTVDIPLEWTTLFCNMSGCVSVGTEVLEMHGNNHIRMVREPEVPGPAANITFAFEYEVVDIEPPFIPHREDKLPDFNPSEVGVIKMERKTKTAAIVAGVTIPLALIAIFGGVWIYKIRHPDEKTVETDDDDSFSPRDLYYKDVLRHRNSRALTMSDRGSVKSVTA